MQVVHMLLSVLWWSASAQAVSLYDCNSPRPEAPGSHNMVLFGVPGEKVYAYHLPLFAGDVNGRSGHVLMHVYQAIWRVSFDESTSAAYTRRFQQERASHSRWPFFTLSPTAPRFRVPQAICDSVFSFRANVVLGHVEGNPDFPPPVPLQNGDASVTREATVFARRFDGSAKDALTYILFGEGNNYYLAHFLTDDENSFDQILSVDSLSNALKNKVAAENAVLLSIPLVPENSLLPVFTGSDPINPNSHWKLATTQGGRLIRATLSGESEAVSLRVLEEVYFNRNADLQVRE